MAKIIKLTESDIKRLVNKVIEEKEIEEGIFDPIKDVYHGVRGLVRGQGYNYSKYTSSLQNLVKDLQRLDKPNHKIMEELTKLRTKVDGSNMPMERKNELLRNIDGAIRYFKVYADFIKRIDDLTTNTLK
jgi:hypothetical protein